MEISSDALKDIKGPDGGKGASVCSPSTSAVLEVNTTHEARLQFSALIAARDKQTNKRAQWAVLLGVFVSLWSPI